MGKTVIAAFGSRCEKANSEIIRTAQALSRCSRQEVETVSIIRGERIEGDDVLIFPLLIQKGYEYGKLKALGKRTALPLLGSRRDAEEAAEIINSTLRKKENTIYLLVFHGSERNKIEEIDELSSLLRDDILTAKLKGDLDKLMHMGQGKHVVIIPFLFTFAHHGEYEIREKILPIFNDAELIEKGVLETFPSLFRILKRHLEELEEQDSFNHFFINSPPGTKA